MQQLGFCTAILPGVVDHGQCLRRPVGHSLPRPKPSGAMARIGSVINGKSLRDGDVIIQFVATNSGMACLRPSLKTSVLVLEKHAFLSTGCCSFSPRKNHGCHTCETQRYNTSMITPQLPHLGARYLPLHSPLSTIIEHSPLSTMIHSAQKLIFGSTR